MRPWFDPSRPVLVPSDLVCAFTRKRPEELTLPGRAIITVSSDDTRFLCKQSSAVLQDAWAPFRRIYRFEGRETVFTRTWYGGPNIASLVEELSAFGVREFCLWGYVGGIAPVLSVGDVVLADGALREEGVSYHYLEEEEEVVYAPWARHWGARPETKGFTHGTVWSCDALYRETARKLQVAERRAMLGVEMEVASLYAVCQAKGLDAVAFLVVSDLLKEDTWAPGFSTPALRRGVRQLGQFLIEHVVV